MLRTLSCVGAVLMLFAVTCVSWATAQSDAIVFVGGTVLTQDPLRILAAATRVAANALGVSETVGTIEAGKVADLVVLAGDPRKDFRVLHNPVAVLKTGRLVSGALQD